MLKLRCRRNQLRALARRYEYDNFDLSDFHPKIAGQGFLTKKDLRIVAEWKSVRSMHHVEKNSDSFVEDVSKFAFSTTDERSRIEILTLLDGVGWPTASVILHFFHRDPYPILDFRALWSLSTPVPNQYSFPFWWDYVKCCRKIAGENRMSMRELDQALWQFSKENQPTS